MTNKTLIQIDDLTSAGIRAQMRRDGITTAERLAENGKGGDQKVVVYRVGSVLVADTNGDPVWQESDPAGFADLMESEGIDLSR